MPHNPKPLELLGDLLEKACKSGADAADAVFFETTELQMSCRQGKPESIERAENQALALRVWVGAKQACVSSSDPQPLGFAELAERAVAMARVATEDADSVLAPDSLLADPAALPALDLFDADEPAPDVLMAQCRAAEAAALSHPGITNSEGADASYHASHVHLMTRPASGRGFRGDYRASSLSVSVSVLAGEGTGMQRDYEFASVRHRADLPVPETVGKRAAERAVSRLNPRRVPTCEVPVVFEPRVSRGLLASFSGAINGAAVARGTSFLKDSLDKPVFSSALRITDDPHRKRGLGSKPFDGEGVRNAPLVLVENGILRHWLLDLRSARKLGVAANGRASKGLSGAPAPASTNLAMQPGKDSPQTLIAGIKNGFYVTETFGMGVNLITGDYSQGASGFWIENGEIAYPVAELTIAGHLRDMFATLVPANDLEYRYATNAPTLLVPKMTVAGA